MNATANSFPSSHSRILLFLLFSWVALTTNQLDYEADHQQIVEGAGDILSYYAMSQAAPDLVSQRVPYHHAQRIVLPYVLGLVSHATRQPIQVVYLVAGTLMLLAAFGFFVRCCELLALTESTQFFMGCVVVFNPYVFRHLIMFNGYINDIGFLLAISLGLYCVLSGKRGWLLVAIIFGALSRQTTLLTIPAWLLLDSVAQREKHLRFDGWSITYGIAPIAIYFATSWVAVRSGLPSETKSALLGIFDWMQTNFSLGRLASFAIRGIIPFVFLLALWWGLRGKSVAERGRQSLVAGLLLLVFSICIQPILGGPDWTTNSIARLNALAVFPAALVVAIKINGALDRVRLSGLVTAVALVTLGSIHHIYTYNGIFSADKNMWFAAIHFLSAVAAGIVLSKCRTGERPASRA